MSISSPGGGGFGFYTASQQIDPGILVQISAFTDATYLQATCTWLEIGICSNPFSQSSRRACLMADYIMANKPLYWNGIFPIEADSLIYMQMRGNLNPVVSIFDHRLTHFFARHLKEVLNALPR